MGPQSERPPETKIHNYFFGLNFVPCFLWCSIVSLFPWFSLFSLLPEPRPLFSVLLFDCSLFSLFSYIFVPSWFQAQAATFPAFLVLIFFSLFFRARIFCIVLFSPIQAGHVLPTIMFYLVPFLNFDTPALASDFSSFSTENPLSNLIIFTGSYHVEQGSNLLSILGVR